MNSCLRIKKSNRIDLDSMVLQQPDGTAGRAGRLRLVRARRYGPAMPTVKKI